MMTRRRLGEMLAPRTGSRPRFWPTAVGNTNLLVALPNQKPPGTREANNHGHSEYKMLQVIGDLIDGFKTRKPGEMSEICNPWYSP